MIDSEWGGGKRPMQQGFSDLGFGVRAQAVVESSGAGALNRIKCATRDGFQNLQAKTLKLQDLDHLQPLETRVVIRVQEG